MPESASWGCLLLGCLLLWGGLLLGGLLLGWSLSWGAPSGGLLLGGPPSGGLLLWGVSLLGGASFLGGLLGKGPPSWGVSLADPPVNRITHSCKNITLATTSLRPEMMIGKAPLLHLVYAISARDNLVATHF